jgi:hypothetical protein
LPKTLYISSNELSTNLWRLSNAAPSAANEATVATVAKTAAGNYFSFTPGTTTTSAFPAFYAGSLSYGSHGWRSESLYTGSFASGNFTIDFKVKQMTKYAHSGRVAAYVFRTSNADPTVAQLTAMNSAEAQSDIIDLGTTADVEFTGSVTVDCDQNLTLDNEYVVIVLNWLITTAGANAAAAVGCIVNEGAAQTLTTTAFTTIAHARITAPTATATSSANAPTVTSAQKVIVAGLHAGASMSGVVPSITATTVKFRPGTFWGDWHSPFGRSEFVSVDATVFAVIASMDATSFIPNIATVQSASINVPITTILFNNNNPIIVVHKFVTVKNTISEIDFTPQIPNVTVVWNAHIINIPPPNTEVEGLIPNIITTSQVIISSILGESIFYGIAPFITTTKTIIILSNYSTSSFEGIVPSVFTTENIISSPQTSEINAEGIVPSVSSTKDTIIKASLSEIEFNGIISIVIATKNSSVSSITSECDFEGLFPYVTASKSTDVSSQTAEFNFVAESPAISAAKVISISAPTADIEFESYSPFISAYKHPTMSAETAEIKFVGKLPSTLAAQNADIDAPKAATTFEALVPTVSSDKHPTISAEVALIEIEAFILNIEVIIGAPILTATQIDDYIYVEWEVG